jgi:hypothetical protein
MSMKKGNGGDTITVDGRAFLIQSPHYVIGRIIVKEKPRWAVFHAIPESPEAGGTDGMAQLTPDVGQWRRWKTRQAAHQWKNKRRRLRELEVRNLRSLNLGQRF